MKKGPLSNKEKQFIDSNKSMSVEKVADKLKRSVEVVSRYISTRDEEETSPTHDLFARKPDRGVTVMTEAASMTSDENKSKREATSPKRYQRIIHKIKKD